MKHSKVVLRILDDMPLFLWALAPLENATWVCFFQFGQSPFKSLPKVTAPSPFSSMATKLQTGQHREKNCVLSTALLPFPAGIGYQIKQVAPFCAFLCFLVTRY